MDCVDVVGDPDLCIPALAAARESMATKVYSITSCDKHHNVKASATGVVCYMK